MTSTIISPVVLPYHNVLLGERGWQFALPGRRLPSGGQAPPDLLILLDSGEHRLERGVVRSSPTETRPGMPMWAWVPVETPEGLEDMYPGAITLQKASPPTPGVGAAPITAKLLPKREVVYPSGIPDEAQFFVTPAGGTRPSTL